MSLGGQNFLLTTRVIDGSPQQRSPAQWEWVASHRVRRRWKCGEYFRENMVEMVFDDLWLDIFFLKRVFFWETAGTYDSWLQAGAAGT